MKSKPIIMIAIAILFGAISIFIADVWINSAVSANAPVAISSDEQKPEVEFNKIVVASASLKYGDVLSGSVLKEIPWPNDALPEGTFGSVEEVLAEENRIALFSIEINEPILLVKISGQNGRATLSNMLGKGMRAITIRVDDVAGVAGFITPGDRVDISMTRKGEATSTQIITQNIKVLTVDQNSDEKTTAPSLVRAVTVEANASQAQKITLARALGALSLSLRAAGDQAVTSGEKITSVNFLDTSANDVVDSKEAGSPTKPSVSRQRTVLVTRGLTPTTYSVVNEEYTAKHRTVKAASINHNQIN